MNKPIFCIVGKSGAGKSTYLDAIINDNRIKNMNIKELKYHTTRKKRNEYEDSYTFVSYDEYISDLQNKNNPIIEERHYKKFDEDVVYYTLKSDLESNNCNGFICAASVDQALSYYDSLDNVYIINIEIIHTKERLLRLINRCNDDIECYEVCRRTLEENDEYNKLYDKSFGTNIIYIDNSDSEGLPIEDIIENNIIEIIKFIKLKL